MFQTTNHISDKTRRIKNFDDDRIATLNANQGLKYWKNKDGQRYFDGNYYLVGENDVLIETFEIRIFIGKNYPFCFPILIEKSNKIERSDEYHIDKDGNTCVEFIYIANAIAKDGIRVYDFLNYYVRKYFMWALVKKHSKQNELQEWGHSDEGKKEFYKLLLNTNDNKHIHHFLVNYCNVIEPERNKSCYCESGKKLKYCHLNEVELLRNTDKKTIMNDIVLFKEV